MRSSNLAHATDNDFRPLNDDEIDFVSGAGTTTTVKITIPTPFGTIEVTRTKTGGEAPAGGGGGGGDSGGGSPHSDGNKEPGGKEN
ncbi:MULTISPECIES: hypothetical protein [unclassified Caulobacter]|uniref:hypothetical protein n=1 Tax=unclassified Caulobacter TaxID=2648921 RepID=UPI0004A6CE1E|nr:hypothetical protein [Caulobacter sp. UNC358MFTsu5.1]